MSVSGPATEPPIQNEEVSQVADDINQNKDKEMKQKQILPQTRVEFSEICQSDSFYPSYTKFKMPYDTVCRLRVLRTKREYERRFNNEIKSIALQQPCAWDGVRVARIFTNGIKVPPYKDPLKPNDRRRLNALLKDTICY